MATTTTTTASSRLTSRDGDAVGDADTGGDDGGGGGLLTLHLSGGGPFGFRLTDGGNHSGQLVISKLRKRGRADEAGLREGDVLVAVNGRSCQGLSCSQAMDLVDSSGNSLAIRVRRGDGTRQGRADTTSSIETSTPTAIIPTSASSSPYHHISSSPRSASSPTRSHSVQDRLKQTVYVPSTDPIKADNFTSTSSSSSSSATVTFSSPNQHWLPPGGGGAGGAKVGGAGSTSSDGVSGGLTVSAPSGVEVVPDAAGRSFTLTIGLDAGTTASAMTTMTTTAQQMTLQQQQHHQQQQQTVTKSTTTTTTTTQHQKIWQPPQLLQQIAAATSKQQQTSMDQHPPVKGTVGPTGVGADEVRRQDAIVRPPALARILQESTDRDLPASPTSPSGRTKKMFIDSAFYDDPEHKYPTVEEQIALARRVAMSVLAPANVNSRGHKMFIRSRERSVRWEAGYKPSEDDPHRDGGSKDDADDDVKFFRAEPWAMGASSTAGSAFQQAASPPPLPIDALSSPSAVPLTTFVFAPKLPSGEKVMDKERLDALSAEELERVMLMEKKSTHTNVNPQLCFNLADDLRNMKGRGGRLFAKRQAKSESWTVGGESQDSPDSELPLADDPTSTSNATIQLKVSADISTESTSSSATGGSRSVSSLPVNRLKEMVELPRPAMTPWDAAVQYGTVDPAFAHLDKPATTAAKRESGGSTGSGSSAGGGGRVKSWNSDAAAGLAAAMTSSLQAKAAGDTKATTMGSGSGYQPVKFSVPSTSADGGAAEQQPSASDDRQRHLAGAVESVV